MTTRFGISKVLNWRDPEKPRRIIELTNLLSANHVDSESELRKWLSDGANTEPLHAFAAFVQRLPITSRHWSALRLLQLIGTFAHSLRGLAYHLRTTTKSGRLSVSMLLICLDMIAAHRSCDLDVCVRVGRATRSRAA